MADVSYLKHEFPRLLHNQKKDHTIKIYIKKILYVKTNNN